jgi:hypothetical protein
MEKTQMHNTVWCHSDQHMDDLPFASKSRIDLGDMPLSSTYNYETNKIVVLIRYLYRYQSNMKQPLQDLKKEQFRTDRYIQW